MAERARYHRELGDMYADEMERQIPWRDVKVAAKIGLGVGFLCGIGALVFGGNHEVCSQLAAVVGVSIMGAFHGLMIELFTRWTGPQWMRKALSGALAVWVAVILCLNWSADKYIDTNSLFTATGFGFLAVAIAWVALWMFVTVVGVFRR